MGGERASKTRDREAGRICCICGRGLDVPPWGWQGENKCDTCDANAPRHRVLLNYMLEENGWRISFLEADCKTAVGRPRTFADPDKIVAMAKRGHADMTSAARCDLENGLRDGRGALWLFLTRDQYSRLR